MSGFRGRKKFILLFLFIFFGIFFWFSLPSPLFVEPTSTVLEDENGELLSARIAGDGQWRFPHHADIPEKFQQAIQQYEDKFFFNHPGINPFSTARALWQNIKEGRVVSGGSTITMQVIRLSRKQKSRTVFEKIIEMWLALRVELSYSKKEILALYASHAPFGGNVVGLDAASWRYYGRSPAYLSWGETTALAVLPNSPSLIYPGKNQERLKKKRDRLIDRLYEAGTIDSAACALAKAEPLPGRPFPLPRLASHLLDRAGKEGYSGKRIRSTLRKELQEQVLEIARRHQGVLRGNGIHNVAAIVLDVETGGVLAYAGNVSDDSSHGKDVDVISSPRSPGSILKPILLAAMLDDGAILPGTLIPDVPTQISGYTPKNYALTYDGAVPARRALARSLNIPAVRMLQSYKYERFCPLLQKTGITTLIKPPSHYGLSVILGGAEVTLWDAAGVYASMARVLNHFSGNNVKYNRNDFHGPLYLVSDSLKRKKTGSGHSLLLSAAAIWQTFEAMVEVSRPDEDAQWQDFLSSTRVAWKTGTSFGFRDGWAIGCTPRHVVAVWVGNASGEGRPGLTGIGTAAPILFDIFRLLKNDGWFDPPYDEMSRIPVCRQSGHRASEICSPVDTAWVQEAGLKTPPCPYHKIIHLDPTGRWQVNDACETPSRMVHKPWFILPPVQEWYYKSKNPAYHPLPPFRNDCASASSVRSMALIYPPQPGKIYVPVEIDGTPGKVVFEAAHRNSGKTIYWHIDEEFIASTKQYHQVAVSPPPGKHKLILVDENGESIEMRFEIIGKSLK